MSLILAQLALQSGLPIIEKLLSRKLGDQGGQLASEVIRAIATRAGVGPEEVEALAEVDPPRALDAMREVERQSPELLALYAAGVQGQFDLLQAEQADPAWMRAWRPGWMYLLGFLWLWNLVLLHIANAFWKIALPPQPTDVLLGLTSLFLALYMGGHTVLRALGKSGDK